MKLGSLGQIAFDPTSFAFNSGGRRSMTWGQYVSALQGALASDLAAMPPGSGIYYPGQPEANVAAIFIVNDGGTVHRVQSFYLTGPQGEGAPSLLIDYSTGNQYTYPGNVAQVTLNGGSLGYSTWQFLQILAQYGIQGFPPSAVASPSALVAFLQSNAQLLEYVEGGYITLNNSVADSPDWGSLLVMGAVAAFAAVAIYTAAAASAAQAATSAPVETATVQPASSVASGASAPVNSTVAAGSTETTSSASLGDLSTGSNVTDLTSLATPGPGTAASLMSSSTGAAPTVTEAASAASTASQGFSLTSLFSGAGTYIPAVVGAAKAISSLTGPKSPALTSPQPAAQTGFLAGINPLFLIAGIGVIAIVASKGKKSGKGKGKSA